MELFITLKVARGLLLQMSLSWTPAPSPLCDVVRLTLVFIASAIIIVNLSKKVGLNKFPLFSFLRDNHHNGPFLHYSPPIVDNVHISLFSLPCTGGLQLFSITLGQLSALYYRVFNAKVKLFSIAILHVFSPQPFRCSRDEPARVKMNNYAQ